MEQNIWDRWKDNLNSLVQTGEKIGLSQNTVSDIGYHVGNLLSANKEPENREEKVLKDLWDAGDDDDRQALSKMIVKMVEKHK